MLLRTVLPFTVVAVAAATGECTKDADCSGKNMTSPKCVNQTGGGWSQCVDCELTAFEYACMYWAVGIRKPAEQTCGQRCTGKPPHNLTCTNDADCPADSPSCVIQSDQTYAQCITCDATQFQADCTHWNSTSFLPRAESKCSLNCTGSGGLACHTDADCTAAGAPTCVVQADGYYAQCITCNATQFQLDCDHWDVAQFLPAAEKKCAETCARKWWKAF